MFNTKYTLDNSKIANTILGLIISLETESTHPHTAAAQYPFLGCRALNNTVGVQQPLRHSNIPAVLINERQVVGNISS